MHTSVEKDPPAAILSHAEETPLLCRRPVRIGLYLFLGLFFLTMLAWRRAFCCPCCHPGCLHYEEDLRRIGL